MSGIQLKLNVPYARRNSAKALGARWNAEQQTWYVPYGVDINAFTKWWPKELKQQAKEVRKAMRTLH